MNATAQHIIAHGRGAGGYLVLARETAHYRCLDSDDRISCPVRHRSLRAADRCSGGTRVAARTRAGDLIRVRPSYLRASNGERAVLPYPDYQIHEAPVEHVVEATWVHYEGEPGETRTAVELRVPGPEDAAREIARIRRDYSEPDETRADRQRVVDVVYRVDPFPEEV